MPLFPQIKFKPQTRTLNINENGISTSIGTINGEYSWGKIASISESDGNIYIVGISGNGFVVPARAFCGVEEKNKFLGLCLQYRAAYKNT
jgi:hypothetical protein